jgi:hypothetical protein
MTFSKREQLFYDLNATDLNDWSSYPRSFIIFVLGREDDVLIIPAHEIREQIRQCRHHASERGNYKLHIDPARFTFNELAGWQLSSYRNAYERFASQGHIPSTAQTKLGAEFAEMSVEQNRTIEKLEEGFVILENQLEDYLARNLSLIEPGLRLYTAPNGTTGKQFHTPIGRIDLLCKGREGFVVIELKAANRSDAVVGQISRYVGWVKEHIAGSAPVKGLILVPSADGPLKYAVAGHPNLDLKYFCVRLEILSKEP